MEKKKVLYLSYESIVDSAILQTQVVPLLNSLQEKFDFTLATFEKDQVKLPEIGIDIIPFTSPQRVGKIFEMVKKLYSNRKDYSIIHVRSYLPMLPVVCLRVILPNSFPKIVFDLRGVFPEEVFLKYKKTKKIKLLILSRVFKVLEYYFLKYADINIVVSENFKKYLLQEYQQTNLKLEDKIEVIPTFSVKPYPSLLPSKKNFEIFDKQDIIFVYSGSVDLWQKFAETIDLFKVIKEKIHKAKLLVLTYNLSEAKNIIETKGIMTNDYYITKCNPSELTDYLKIGDFAFLLREQSVVNRVAAPIKFTDYLSAGLQIILSKGIGDTEELVRKHDIGHFLDGFTKEEMINFVDHNIRFFSKKNKDRKSSKILDSYVVENASNRYLSVYNMLSK